MDSASSGSRSDLELTKLCAEAMRDVSIAALEFLEEGHRGGYEPLTDDAQALALLKRFHLSVGYNRGWGAVKNDERGMLLSGAYHYESLTRAIVECVANLQQSDVLVSPQENAVLKRTRMPNNNEAFEQWWSETAAGIDERSKPIAKAAWEEALRQEHEKQVPRGWVTKQEEV